MLTAKLDCSVGLLTHDDLPQALEFAQRYPVESVLLSERLARAINTGGFVRGGGFWAVRNRGGEVVGLCWHGAVTIISSAPQAAAQVAHLLSQLPALEHEESSSIVGPAEVILPLWEHLKSRWPEPREVRSNQPSMQLWLDPHRPLPYVATPTQVRAATPGDFAALLPACVAMFTEEVGYIPDPAPQGPYGLRVHSLVSQQRAYLMLNEAEDRVLFKTEIGALGLGVSQLQGVWVAPELRGTGVGTAALAQMLNLMAESGANRVSLYVNSYNTAALALYRRLGFEQVGTFATVLM